MKKTAAIIGGGVIGGGWAARFLLNGWDVNIFDPDPASERKIGEVLSNARHALPMIYDLALPAQGRLTHCQTLEQAVTGAIWIQESVPERLDLKHKVYQEISTVAAKDAVIGSSTSGFKPSQLQEGLQNPEQVLVTHPFNPVYLLPVVELVPSQATSEHAIAFAKSTMEAIGMYPLHIRKEIDAHVADRLLEAVWREALWLVKDGVATTEEIDNVIRYGFGLRWAQMGLFETYRVAGGEAGMKHFMAQFGPALKWPWTKLMDVPEFNDQLVDLIADQSDAQSGQHSIRELERMRDENLVSILRALKGRDAAAGTLVNSHEATLGQDPSDVSGPIRTIDRVVPIDWTDYNGHMNESRYGQVFSDAADTIMRVIGADGTYISNGLSYFTVDIRISFLAETHAGQSIHVQSQILSGRGKKLRLYHAMHAEDGHLLATADQLLIHVSLETRRSCEPTPRILENVEKIAAAHAELPWPNGVEAKD